MSVEVVIGFRMIKLAEPYDVRAAEATSVFRVGVRQIKDISGDGRLSRRQGEATLMLASLKMTRIQASAVGIGIPRF
jgi:hypothetical protein